MPKSFPNFVFYALAFVLSLSVYLLTLAPSVLFGDGGEFQFVTWLPGIAHPTGYPLYTLLGWVFTHLLPVGEVAWRANLFSALLGAATVGVVYQLGQVVLARCVPEADARSQQITALGLALLFAFSPSFWSQAIIAEVYTLHALLLSLIFLLLLRLPQTDTAPAFRHLWLPAVIFGLGLSHHRTTVLILPAILVYLWLRGLRPSAWRLGLGLGGLLLLPLLLYAYIPLIAPSVPYREFMLSPDQTLTLYEHNWRGFWLHITGQVFQGEVQPGAIDLDRLGLSLDFLRQQVGWLGTVLGLAGMAVSIKDRRLLSLLGLSFMGLYTFNLIYFIGDIEVLFIPCWLILCLWIGVGWLWLSHRLSEALLQRKTLRSAEFTVLPNAPQRLRTRLGLILGLVASLCFLLFPLSRLIQSYPSINQANNTLARDAWTQILAMDLPADAILLSNDRNELMPLWYYQFVTGQQPGWLGLFPLITPDPAFRSVGGVLDQALASDRPVYLIKPMPGLNLKADLTALPAQPLAQLYQATPIDTTLQSPASIPYGDSLQLIGQSQALRATELSVTLYWQVSTPLAYDYTTYVHLIDAEDLGRVQSDHRPGGVYYPSSLWQPGETLRDQHTLNLPADVPPGSYELLVGVYRQTPSGEIRPLGAGQVIGVIVIE